MIDEKTAAELQSLSGEHTLLESDSIQLILFQGYEAPALMQLIGRAREITFQAIGAGSGNDVDLSSEDDYYHHLMLWDKENQTLAGAYRIGFIQEIISTQGIDGLYLNHIFNIAPKLYHELGNAMELSRSFILPNYQKNPQILDTLWKGLAIASQKKSCTMLYGSVTISAAFSSRSKAILVETLRQCHSDEPDLRALTKAPIPFQAENEDHIVDVEEWKAKGINRLNQLIEEIEGGKRSIPPLIRYYVALGAKFLSFHVEPTFNNAIYCLLKVDIHSMPRRYRKRFFGER